MNRLLLILSTVCLMATAGYSQKIAVVDVGSLLNNLDEYKEAQEQLDQQAQTWQQEIAVEQDKVKSMYNKYQAELVLLSEDMKQQKEEEIMAKEKDIREMQRQKFGPEGDLFQRRQELVSPIQERVYSAIEGYANDRGYDIILDKGGSAGILFTNDTFDKTEEVMRVLKNR